jgi:hypothetical protein
MPFVEHYMALPIIKKYIKFLMLLVKYNIFLHNIKYTKHAVCIKLINIDSIITFSLDHSVWI